MGRTRGKPTSVDAHVGQRIRVRRTLLGLSQGSLAEAVGITFQQIQKYEWGANRIGAGRLYQLSQALQVPVSYFFEGLNEGDTTAGPSLTGAADELLSSRSNVELLQAYHRIPDPALQQNVRQLIRLLADSCAAGEASELLASEAS